MPKETPLKQLCNNSNFFLISYYQVQGEMHITNRTWYDFVVWMPRESELHVERIFYNSHLWEQTIYLTKPKKLFRPYKALSASPSSVLQSVSEPDCMNVAQERVYNF